MVYSRWPLNFSELDGDGPPRASEIWNPGSGIRNPGYSDPGYSELGYSDQGYFDEDPSLTVTFTKVVYGWPWHFCEQDGYGPPRACRRTSCRASHGHPAYPHRRIPVDILPGVADASRGGSSETLGHTGSGPYVPTGGGRRVRSESAHARFSYERAP